MGWFGFKSHDTNFGWFLNWTFFTHSVCRWRSAGSGLLRALVHVVSVLSPWRPRQPHRTVVQVSPLPWVISPTVLPHHYITAVVTRNALLLGVHATVTLWTVVHCVDVCNTSIGSVISGYYARTYASAKRLRTRAE
jgi:hypothetical protein